MKTPSPNRKRSTSFPALAELTSTGAGVKVGSGVGVAVGISVGAGVGVFSGVKVTYAALENYGFFKNALDILAAHLKIERRKFNYKKIDQGLWLYGKYLYAEKNQKLPDYLSEKIRRVLDEGEKNE